jgi:cyclic-di-GMP phosphodiesterase, flagellum assembly factor TipF
MARIAAFFVAICMLLIAGAVATLLYVLLGLSGSESALAGLACLSALALYNATARRDPADMSGPVADLSRGTADLARQVTDLGRRVSAMEGKLEKVARRPARRRIRSQPKSASSAP